MKKVSICIPTTELIYSDGTVMGPHMLNHLLKSISTQTYKNIEIIISDQSKTDIIEKECGNWDNLNIYYYKNDSGRGSAAKNLNYSFTKASGDIIKPIFQDDFFYTNTSIEYIVNNLGSNKWGFFGTYHCNENYTQNLIRPMSPIWEDPIKILSGVNTVSGPSVMFFENNYNFFDENLGWLNDVEFYYRLFKKYGLPLLLPYQKVVQRLRSEGVSNTLDLELKSQEEKYVLSKHDIINGSKKIEDYPSIINRVKKINYEL